MTSRNAQTSPIGNFKMTTFGEKIITNNRSYQPTGSTPGNGGSGAQSTSTRPMDTVNEQVNEQQQKRALKQGQRKLVSQQKMTEDSQIYEDPNALIISTGPNGFGKLVHNYTYSNKYLFYYNRI